MRILITGGAGFIGSALTRRLVASGHEVRVFDNFSRGRAARLDGVHCEVVPGDVRDERAVTTAAHGCDTIAHLAYLQGTQTFYAEPRQVLDTAMRGMVNVLAACEAAAAAHLLLVSSSEAYQVAPVVPTPEDVPLTVPDVMNPRYSYGGGKIASEIMALAWQRGGVLDRAVIARPHNIIGPDMGREHVVPEFALRMAAADREQPDGVIGFPIQGTGQETRSFCSAGDCTAQLELLLAAGSTGVYHVGAEDERTISDVARAVAACFGRQVKVVPGRLPEGSPPRRLPDLAKIKALGWEPSGQDFAAYLAPIVAWYRAHE